MHIENELLMHCMQSVGTTMKLGLSVYGIFIQPGSIENMQ